MKEAILNRLHNAQFQLYDILGKKKKKSCGDSKQQDKTKQNQEQQLPGVESERAGMNRQGIENFGRVKYPLLYSNNRYMLL